MKRALALAERGRGYVEPNPLVGAVLVRDGIIVGDGWHERFGEAHAEIIALARAGAAAQGSTLYVTLEPCCHHGKTPPCTDALLNAGVEHVYAALEDPFPKVAGKGAAVLREAGVSVEFGLCAAEARRQNAPYLKLLSAGRPYVHAKWAMTLDGKIGSRGSGTAVGRPLRISNETSRARAHGLRGQMDAILAGIGTALCDNPLLTPRPPGPRLPCRVVLDSRARLPITSRLVTTALDYPLLVVVSADADSGQVDALRSLGCEVWQVPRSSGGHLDVGDLLDEMGRRRWTNVLVEGGAEILGSFLEASLVDEVHVFIAPKLLGGRDAVSAVGGQGLGDLKDLSDTSVEILDGDVYVRGKLP